MNDTPKTSGGERVAKRIAASGLCSRREAERWIAEGRVRVNGVPLSSPAHNVTEKDTIEVDGAPIGETPATRLWLYHKPAGLITTHRDPEGRPTVFDALPKDLPRVVSVGRLDLTSEGLLLLTNDGALARHLELPSTGWIRRYRARVYGHVTPADLGALRRGVTVEGVAYGSIEAAVERTTGSHSWVSVALTEGKNREIRRVFEHLGYQVTRLIRVAYGSFELGDLAPGEVREVLPPL